MKFSPLFKNRIQIPIKIGSVWQAPNNIWTTNFARNKRNSGMHPAILERINNDKITAYLTPGTSQDYNKGTCVFKTRLANNIKQSYFLLRLTMPITVNELEELNMSWNGVSQLSEKQVEDLKWQVKMCSGKIIHDVQIEPKSFWKKLWKKIR